MHTPAPTSSPSFDKMRDASYILALIGMFVLLAAGAAWWDIFRQPQTVPSTGRLQLHPRRANVAAIATVAAFGLSVVAAFLAIVSWMF